jgi:hypothetical protein
MFKLPQDVTITSDTVSRSDYTVSKVRMISE